MQLISNFFLDLFYNKLKKASYGKEDKNLWEKGDVIENQIDLRIVYKRSKKRYNAELGAK